MKLRLLDDSIRLRLDRREVEVLGAGGTVHCTTHLPGRTEFGYELRGGGDAMRVEFANDTLSVVVPTPDLAAWAEDESRVGIRKALPIDAGHLTVLIEKDFECLDPRPGESQHNRFRNPKAEQGR